MLISADTPGCTKRFFCERAELFHCQMRACNLIPWLLPTIVFTRRPACVVSEVKRSTLVGSEEILIVSWSETGAIYTVGKSGFTSRTGVIFDKRKRAANVHYRNKM